MSCETRGLDGREEEVGVWASRSSAEGGGLRESRLLRLWVQSFSEVEQSRGERRNSRRTGRRQHRVVALKGKGSEAGFGRGTSTRGG